MSGLLRSQVASGLHQRTHRAWPFTLVGAVGLGVAYSIGGTLALLIGYAPPNRGQS